MFYQSQNSLFGDVFKMESGFDFHFPAHLHSSFELCTVTEGEMIVTVDRKEYRLIPGMACLIFPNQVHSFSTPEHSRHFLCIFSPKLVQTYTQIVASRIPEENLFSVEPFYLKKLIALGEEDGVIDIKGLLYAICGAFHRVAVYQERPIDRHALLFKIFHFVETNYSKECTLFQLAESTSYHYVYLSKYFKQCTGLPFTVYVNHYRINEACRLLKNTNHSVLEVAFDSGFDSLRSFNRNFKNILGMTPSEYKKAAEVSI